MDYFWYPYIPYGAVTVIQGIPGAGKTRIALDLLSRASKASPLPDGSAIPEALAGVYCGYLEHTEQAKGFLHKAGADLSHVAYPSDPGLIPLRQAILEAGARLAVIDPAEYFFDGHPGLRRLHHLAAETGAALILASYKGRINAPSILHVKCGGAALRYLRQIQGPEGATGDDYALGFRIDGKIDWLYHCGKIHNMGECNLKKEFLMNRAMLHASPLPA